LIGRLCTLFVDALEGEGNRGSASCPFCRLAKGKREAGNPTPTLPRRDLYPGRRDETQRPSSYEEGTAPHEVSVLQEDGGNPAARSKEKIPSPPERGKVGTDLEPWPGITKERRKKLGSAHTGNRLNVAKVVGPVQRKSASFQPTNSDLSTTFFAKGTNHAQYRGSTALGGKPLFTNWLPARDKVLRSRADRARKADRRTLGVDTRADQRKAVFDGGKLAESGKKKGIREREVRKWWQISQARFSIRKDANAVKGGEGTTHVNEKEQIRGKKETRSSFVIEVRRGEASKAARTRGGGTTKTGGIRLRESTIMLRKSSKKGGLRRGGA